MRGKTGRRRPARLRQELVEAVANGLRPTTAAKIAGVSRVTIWRWVAAARQAPAILPEAGVTVDTV